MHEAQDVCKALLALLAGLCPAHQDDGVSPPGMPVVGLVNLNFYPRSTSAPGLPRALGPRSGSGGSRLQP